MSRSPDEDASSDEIRAYDVGWAATNQLIRSGSSFSGRERNCVFLNLGGENRFADLSATSGLDFPEDGRGLALCDWDHDGRVDLWVMNRTGPRVRFMKNNLETGNQFVSIRLKGTDGNVDGIGARVKVIPNDQGGQGDVLVKTVRAGSGFLSQSSKWLHFGLGRIPKGGITSVEVHWPGGETETFAEVAPGAHYILEEGRGSAVKWDPPAISSVAFDPDVTSPISPPEVPSRVVLVNPPPIPAQLEFTNEAGANENLLERFKDQPTVLNLWASWCPNCEVEMKEWAEDSGKLEAAGLKVLAICVDQPGGDPLAALSLAKSKAREWGFPFELGHANASLIENLNILQRAFIGRQTDFPLPSTLLVDASGKVSAIYKGPVSVERLVKDSKACGVSQKEMIKMAVPEAGRWKTTPKGLLPRMVAVKMISNGMLDDARAYINQLIKNYAGSEDEKAVSEFAECHRVLGAIAHEKGELERAIKFYQRSLEIVPEQEAVLRELMNVHLVQGDLAKAAEQLETMLKIDRNDFENLAQLGKLRDRQGKVNEAISLYRESLGLRFHPETAVSLANKLRDQGRAAEAVKHYEAVLKVSPGNILAANNYAWILATHPKAEVRDGELAVMWAGRACELTDHGIPPLLGTLAAANAELGKMELAVELSQKAITKAREFQKEEMAKRLEEKMKLYQEGQPFRDAALLADAGGE